MKEFGTKKSTTNFNRAKMKLRKYILTLKSDSGLMRVQTVGTSARNVITSVLNQQNAPFRALKSIRITPLK